MVKSRKKKPDGREDWFSGTAPALRPIPGLVVYCQPRITPLQWEAVGRPSWGVCVLVECGGIDWYATNVPASVALGVALEPERHPLYVSACWEGPTAGDPATRSADALCRIIPDPRCPVGVRGRDYKTTQRPAWYVEGDRLSEVCAEYTGYADLSSYYIPEEIFHA